MQMRVEVEKVKTTKCVYIVDAETIEEAHNMVYYEQVEPKQELSREGYVFQNFCTEVLKFD